MSYSKKAQAISDDLAKAITAANHFNSGLDEARLIVLAAQIHDKCRKKPLSKEEQKWNEKITRLAQAIECAKLEGATEYQSDIPF